MRAEEESLARAAAASDSEVARAVATYTGQLDEVAVASKSLVDRLQPKGGSKATGHMYYYQCLDAIEKLQDNMQGQFTSTAERVRELVEKNNDMPSPWKEFAPFAAQNISELLHVAKMEHARISRDALDLAKKTLQLDVESELLAALIAEADKLLLLDDHKELLERCRSISNLGGPSGSIDLAIDKAAADLADPAIMQMRDGLVPSQYEQDLGMVNSSHNELVCVQKQSIDKGIDSVLRLFDSQQAAVENILQSLADESSMVDGWCSLWSKVSADLDSQNEEPTWKASLDLLLGASS
ncbi:hypothetical protein LPJ75_001307, partial [Coemansia sp. RSA 2598]